SDHGEAFRQHGRMLHNTTVFDEMLHVPFLMRFPKALELPAGRITHPVSLIDVAPTLADIYGISELPEFSGTSLMPLILGEEDSWQHFVYAESLYTGVRTLRDAQYKYIHSPADGDMLFDMTADPLEQHNLLDSLAVTVGYYRRMIRPYLRESSATQNVELNTLGQETLKNLEDLGYIQ
ncbi:MAG: sulfatase-like hydrolase/transferase, partial [bacterium]|nr:sulfatase-like hydrolase/transferase [bacterium]